MASLTTGAFARVANWLVLLVLRGQSPSPFEVLMRQTITAFLVIHNEERVIRRCLESLKDVVDEIVVVHDGECTDATLEICRQYTDRVFVRPRMANCDPHRPFALDKATGDWVLQIDADEFLPEELRTELRRLVECPDVDLYCFVWPFTDGKRSLTLTIKHPYRPCLARRNMLYFYGMPDQSLQTYGRQKRMPLILGHRPLYDNYTWHKFHTKWLPNARLRARFIWNDPEEIPCFGLRDRMPLAKYLAANRRYPLLRMLAVFLRFLAYHLYKGMWKIGPAGLKITLMSALDNARTYYYVYKYRPSGATAAYKKEINL